MNPSSKELRKQLIKVYNGENNEGSPIWHVVDKNRRAKACIECFVGCSGIGIFGPAPCWHVGGSYGRKKPKILFVGKWMEWNERESFKPRTALEAEELKAFDPKTGNLNFKSSPFWRFICKVSEKIYNEDKAAFQYAAITNLVKCVSGDKREEPLVTNCIEKLGIFQREMEVLKPDVVIFMTGWFASDYVEEKMKPYKKLNNKTTTSISIGNKPKFIWTWHPGAMQRKKIFPVVVKEVVGAIQG